MKTLYRNFLAALFVFSGFAASAQDLKFGPRAGLNFSTYTGEDVHHNTIKPGVHAGAYLIKDVTEQLSFQSELLFSMKGAAWKKAAAKSSQTLYYLDIPVFCGLNIADKWRVLFGLQPSIYLGGRDRAKAHANDKVTVTHPKKIRSVDLGAIAGVEYDLGNGLNLGFRASHGFMNVTSVKHNGVFNLNLQVTAGFTLGK